MSDLEKLVDIAERKERECYLIESSALYLLASIVDKNQSNFLFKAAVNARVSGFFNLAEMLFLQYEAIFGRDYHWCMEVGHCKLALDKFMEAYEFFYQARSFSDKADPLIWSGVALRRIGQYSDAIELLCEAYKSDPSASAILVELAGCQESLGNTRESINIYRNIISNYKNIDKDFIYNRLIICLSKLSLDKDIIDIIISNDYIQNVNSGYAKITTISAFTKYGNVCGFAAFYDFIAKLSLQKEADCNVVDALCLLLAGRAQGDSKLSSLIRAVLIESGYGRSALRILDQNSYASLVNELKQVKFHDLAEDIGLVCDFLETQRTFSFIRLGDGEGNFLATRLERGNEFLVHQEVKILNNWFGAPIGNLDEYVELYRDLESAIRSADILGVPDQNRLTYEASNDPRGYWGVYFATKYSMLYGRRARWVTPVLHLHMFLSERFVAALRNRKIIHTISCHAEFGKKIRKMLNVSQGKDLIVPGEKGVPSIPGECKVGDHFKDYYNNVKLAISGIEQGSVVLVAAGVCGKVYAHEAAKAGGVGLDIGAIADYIMGIRSREIFHTSQFQSTTEKSTFFSS